MTTARALRGPFDYRLPEELREGVDVGSMLVVPVRPARGARRGRGARRPQRGRRGEAARAAAGARARRAGRPRRARRVDRRASTARRSPARSRLVLPPGAARRLSGRRRRRGRRARAICRWARAARDAPGADGRPAGGARAARSRRSRHGGRSERLLHGVTGSGKTEVYLRAAAAALRAGPRRDRAGARDRAHAADRRALHRTLRRDRRGAALALAPRRALRRVAAAARGRGPRVRGPALGRVRADRRPRPDRRRRGARRLLQARGRPALRRPRRRRRARAGAAARCCCSGSATPRPESVRAPVLARPPGGSTAGRCRPWRCWTCAASSTGCIRCTTAGARRRAQRSAARRSCCSTAAAGRTSSPAAPAGASGAARTATSRSSCTGRGGYVACHHCGHREPAPSRCGDCASTSVARHGAGTERLAARARGGARRWRLPDLPSGRRLDGGRRTVAAREGTASATLLRRFEDGRRGRADRHPDGRQGPRLPGRHARRRARRRRHPALPGLPRRGAHVRARSRSSPAASAGAATGRVLVQTIAPEARRDRARGPPRQRRLPRRASSSAARALGYPPFSHLIRIVCSPPSRRAHAAAGAVRAALARGRWRRRREPGSTKAGASPSCSVPPPSSGCAAASDRCWS